MEILNRSLLTRTSAFRRDGTIEGLSIGFDLYKEEMI